MICKRFLKYFENFYNVDTPNKIEVGMYIFYGDRTIVYYGGKPVSRNEVEIKVKKLKMVR